MLHEKLFISTAVFRINPIKEQPMKNIAYFGIDYHLNTLTIAVMIEGSKDIEKTIRIKNDDKMIKKFIPVKIPSG